MKRRDRYTSDRLRLASLLPISIILCLLSAPILAQENQYAEHLRVGTDAMTRGSFSEAKADIEAAVRLEPENPAGWYEMGVLYGRVGDFRSAEAAFRHTLELQPNLAKAHYMLGLSLIANPQSKLDWPGAIAEFGAAVKIQPDYPEALTYLGVGLTATGQIDVAIAELEKAVRAAPLLPSAHFNLAIALEKGERLEEAAKEYREAIAAKGSYAEASSALGKLLLRMGKVLEAEEELRRALRLNPDLQDAHYALAQVLKSLKRQSEAKIEFEEAVALGQREPDAIESSQLSNSAMKLASNGDLAGAETSLRKAILLRPEYGVPHYNLGLILADRRELNSAAQQLTQAISLLPGQAMPWFDLGRVQQLQGNSEDALRSIAWAARLAPSDPHIREELTRLAGDKDMTPARTEMPGVQAMTGVLSDTAKDHLAFAKELSGEGDLQGAIGQLLRLLTLLPADLDARRRVAANYQQLGSLNQAKLEYEKALLVSPGDVETYLALSRIFLAQGRQEEAVEELRRALTHSPDSAEVQKALLQATQKH